MPYGIYEASAKAKALIKPEDAAKDTTPSSTGVATKYSLELLKVGQAVAVPHDDVKLASFRVYVTRTGQKLSRKFTVISHDESRLYEVARIA
jgi:hypothetical protein